MLVISSWPEMTATSEVVLSIEMVSLPIGGMMTRIAWGSMIRRIVSAEGHPQRLRRLGLAPLHRDDAGAHELGGVGRFVQTERQYGRDEARR